MARYKYSMIFDYFSGITATNPVPIRIGGWTESYVAPNYDDATYQAFLLLIQARLGICPRGTVVNRVRVQQIDPVAASSLTTVAYSAPTTWLSDVPQMALKIPFFIGTGTGQILREFRGLPDVMVTAGEYTPTGPFTTALKQFLNTLTNGKWFARRRDKSQTSYKIKSIDAAGNVVMIDQFVPAAVGGKIQVLRTTNPNNGRKFGYFATITAVTDQFHFAIAAPAVVASNFGNLRLAAIITSSFTGPSYNTIQAVVRKVGRPFRSYSGRVSKRA